MKNFTVNPDTKITLYLKECYGCDRKGKFDPIRRFILDPTDRAKIIYAYQNANSLLDVNIPKAGFADVYLPWSGKAESIGEGHHHFEDPMPVPSKPVKPTKTNNKKQIKKK